MVSGFTGKFAGCGALMIALLLGMASCNVDLFGFFGSTGLDERLTARGEFNFLPNAWRTIAPGDAYSFIVVSDTHIEDTGGEEADSFGLDRLAQALEGDAFVVITGDITQQGKRKEVRKFIEIARSLGVPCYPVIGNHDIYSNSWPVWRELIGSASYRIDGGGTTLFMLDTANAYFGADQLDRLERELKTAGERVFVFTHANFFVKSMGDLQQLTDVRERARVISLLAGRADAVFTGHVHKRIIEEIGGVWYINLEDYRSSRTYCRVFVSKAGIRWEFKSL